MADCLIDCDYIYGWYCEHFDEFAEGIYTACENCECFVGEEENEQFNQQTGGD